MEMTENNWTLPVYTMCDWSLENSWIGLVAINYEIIWSSLFIIKQSIHPFPVSRCWTSCLKKTPKTLQKPHEESQGKKLKEICEKTVSAKIIEKGKWKFKRTDNCTDAVIVCDIHMED